MLEKIKKCFGEEKYLYSQHAREEMEVEELGEIKDKEVFEAVLNGKVIEGYPEDKPYPSCLFPISRDEKSGFLRKVGVISDLCLY